jgi:hypothetical protein
VLALVAHDLAGQRERIVVGSAPKSCFVLMRLS